MTTDIYNRAIEIPIEEKLQLVDELLIDISSINSTIEEKWIKESEARLKDYSLGKVQAIPGEKVFAKINQKYNYDL